MNNYISENMPPAEVLRLYGDHVPEFMRAWLERTVCQAEDGLRLWEIIYVNSDMSTDSCGAFELDFIELQKRTDDYAALLDRAVDKLQDYCAEANGDMPDALCIEIDKALRSD